MKIHLTQDAQTKIQKLCRKNPPLKSKFLKQLGLLKQNPKHPSLKLHKLVGKRSQQYSIWIHNNLRALFLLENEVCIIFDIVSHDEY